MIMKILSEIQLSNPEDKQDLILVVRGSQGHCDLKVTAIFMNWK